MSFVKTETPLHAHEARSVPRMILPWTPQVARCLNQPAFEPLFWADPSKPRRVYLEFTHADISQILYMLETFGFDLGTLRRTRVSRQPEGTHHAHFSCLITGSSSSIVQFLSQYSKVALARVDLSEFSWLSAVAV